MTHLKDHTFLMPVLPGKEAGKMRIKFTKGMTPESIADYFLHSGQNEVSRAS